MEKGKYDCYVSLIRDGLVPALGCTEPIAIAYVAANATRLLGEKPEHITAKCSGNIIKNVKGVMVPNSGGMKGIEIAAVLGAMYGDADSELEVLTNINETQSRECRELVKKGICQCRLAEGVANLYISITAEGNGHKAEVVVSDTHTNIIRKVKDDEVILDKQAEEKKENRCFILDSTIREVVKFANIFELKDLEYVLKRQIECNYAIAEEGLKNSYGGNVGKIILKGNEGDVKARAKAVVAAASDARMGGCSLPVVINSGSGNQGLAISLPVVEYGRFYGMDEERIMRALALSNLMGFYVKKKIGSLSAFCGAVTAASSAGAGIGYLKGFNAEQIGKVVEITLANIGGMICDGAKASCAAKLATSLDGAFLAIDMVEAGQKFDAKEGLIGIDPDETVRNVCYIGKNGMRETDVNILRIMTGEISTDHI